MVRKIRNFVLMVCAALIIAVTPLTAHADSYTVYDGNPSNTYITYFKDMLNKYPANNDHVAFRSDQYTYKMAVGDLEINGNTISGDTVSVVTISTGSSYNTYYQMSVADENNFSVNAGDAIIYSNLGYYPSLIERGDNYAFATVLLLLVALCMYLIRSVFSWSLRNR